MGHLPLFPTMSWNPFTNTHGPHGGPPPAYMSNNVFRPMPYHMPAPMPIPMPMAAPIFAPPIFMAPTFGGYGGAYSLSRPWRPLHLLPATPPWPLPSVLPAAVARASARPTLHSATTAVMPSAAASASPLLSPPAVLVAPAPAETLASVLRTVHAAPSLPPPAVLVELAPVETLASVLRTAHAAPSPLPAPPPPAPAATRAPAAPTANAKSNPIHAYTIP